MAGIRCEICGGQLRMQANRTAGCQKCGMVYTLEALREMASFDDNAQFAGMETNEISREALLVYLEDVRLLETLRRKDSERLAALQEKQEKAEKKLLHLQSEERRLKAEKEKLEHLKQPVSEPRIRPVQKIAGIICIVSIGIFLAAVLALTANHLLTLGTRWFECAAVLLAAGASALVIAGMVFFITKSKNEYKYSRYGFSKKMQDEYAKGLQNCQSGIQRYEERISAAKQTIQEAKQTYIPCIDDLKDEYAEIDEILQDAYIADIIPIQFRSIEGVYYLYDYLSTTNSLISEAVGQPDLDSVRQKLEQVIQLHSAQIIQQAQAHAIGGKKPDFHAESPENGDIASKYAKIAAIDSAVSAKLNTKQLACQRAELWLS